MKANELMIGDWVWSVANVAPFQVDAYCLKDFIENEEAFEIDIEPIPLTPEILEKNGFEEFYGWRILDIDAIEIRWTGTILEISGELGNMELPNVQYVHQLQHAFRLCGISKEIEL